jgi:serine protease Do
VIVAEVLPGSPAATAGLATGDVIDGFNGRPVHSAHELRELVFHTPDAGDAALRVTRAGEVHEMRVLLSPR